MLDEDRKFWRRYLILCTIIFAGLVSGLNWDLNHLGFNPLTGTGLPQNQQVDYFRDKSGFHIYYKGSLIALNSSLLPDIPQDQCYQLSLNVDVIHKSVSMTSTPTQQFLCGLAPVEMGIP